MHTAILNDKIEESGLAFCIFFLRAVLFYYSWFTLIYMVDNYNTRSTCFDIKLNNIFIINARTTHGLKLLNVAGPKLWNHIPDS